MPSTTPPHPAARATRRPAPLRAAVALATLAVTAAGANWAAAQELPARQNRPAGEPPPATRPAEARPAEARPADVTWPVPAPADRPPPRPLPDAGAGAVDGPDLPAAGPVTPEVRADLTKAFAELAHPEPAVREAARVRLMGTPRRHLPALEQVVRDNLPLAPAQATVLREIVAHVFLAGEPYASSSRQGFLGVRLAEVNVGDRAETPPDPQAARPPARAATEPRLVAPRILPPGQGPFVPVPVPNDEFFPLPPTAGVAIVERMPGFCGARMFRDGDVVLAVVVGRDRHPTRGTSLMAEAVRQVGAGQPIQFEVLRQGQVVPVLGTLDPRPDEADLLGTIQTLLDNRRLAFEAYWGTSFGPMLKEKAG